MLTTIRGIFPNNKQKGIAVSSVVLEEGPGSAVALQPLVLGCPGHAKLKLGSSVIATIGIIIKKNNKKKNNQRKCLLE